MSASMDYEHALRESERVLQKPFVMEGNRDPLTVLNQYLQHGQKQFAAKKISARKWMHDLIRLKNIVRRQVGNTVKYGVKLIPEWNGKNLVVKVDRLYPSSNDGIGGLFGCSVAATPTSVAIGASGENKSGGRVYLLHINKINDSLNLTDLDTADVMLISWDMKNISQGTF